MICVDRSIKRFIRNAEDGNCQDTRIFDADGASVTSVGYDLRTKQFCYGKGRVSEDCVLDPGEAVFVAAEETVQFAGNMIGRVYLKNSRLRQGLSLEAPVYQPGHKTRIFFRVMNVSENRITLRKGESYAMLVFEALEGEPEKAYAGTFSDEDIFKGLADYSAAYREQIQSVGGKLEQMQEIEQRMYGNVSVLMTVFIGIFTLLNINISLAKEAASAASFVLFNSGTLCAISFLMAMINEMMQRNEKNKIHWIWWIPVICAAAAVAGYALLK